MGGKIPLSATESETPDTLNKVIVGTQTAKEIKWLKYVIKLTPSLCFSLSLSVRE